LYSHVGCNHENVTHDVIQHFLKTEVHVMPLKVMSVLQLKVTVIKSMFYDDASLKAFFLI
jgi:hypothetical protein